MKALLWESELASSDDQDNQPIYQNSSRLKSNKMFWECYSNLAKELLADYALTWLSISKSIQTD